MLGIIKFSLGRRGARILFLRKQGVPPPSIPRRGGDTTSKVSQCTGYTLMFAHEHSLPRAETTKERPR